MNWFCGGEKCSRHFFSVKSLLNVLTNRPTFSTKVIGRRYTFHFFSVIFASFWNSSGGRRRSSSLWEAIVVNQFFHEIFFFRENRGTFVILWLSWLAQYIIIQKILISIDALILIRNCQQHSFLDWRRRCFSYVASYQILLRVGGLCLLYVHPFPVSVCCLKQKSWK